MEKVPYRKPAFVSSPGLSGCPMAVRLHCALSGGRAHIALICHQCAPPNGSRHGEHTTLGTTWGAIGTCIDQTRGWHCACMGPRAPGRSESHQVRAGVVSLRKGNIFTRARSSPALAIRVPCGGLPTPRRQFIRAPSCCALTPDEPPADITLKLAPGLPKALSVTPLLPVRRPWGRVIPRPPPLSTWRKQQ